jgi:prepilin-type N-terminal cleavage/methylation domain-containing protein
VQKQSLVQRRGFTLIEVLVSVTLMIVLTSGAIASYRVFLQRQQVLQSARNVQQMFTVAQKKARVGEKPAGCQTLQGYAVQGIANGNIISVNAVCRNGGAEQRYTVSTTTLVGNSRLEQAVDATLKVLTGGITAGTDVTVTITNSVNRFQFTVNRGGGISEGQYVP